MALTQIAQRFLKVANTGTIFTLSRPASTLLYKEKFFHSCLKQFAVSKSMGYAHWNRPFSTAQDDYPEASKSLPPVREHFLSSPSYPYWDYSFVYGPDSWMQNWPYGKSQSPIDISQENSEFDQHLSKSDLKFPDGSPFHISIGNSGLTIKCHPRETDNIPIIFDGPLDSHFQFVELHFHWGKTNDIGSEHTIDNKTYPAEAHLVHWNKSLYKNFEEAKNSPNGLAVLGVFLTLTDKASAGMDILTNSFDQVTYKNSTFNLEPPFDPYFLVPLHSPHYWTYQGSLTTPPCTENVTWILFRDAAPITITQLEKFRELKAVESQDKDATSFHDPMGGSCPYVGCGPPTIGNNFRPVLPVNNRKIRTNFRIE